MTPEQIREARRGLGLTQAQLAHILGVTARTVRRWEAGRAAGSRTDIPPTAERALGWLRGGFRPPQWPTNKPTTKGKTK